MKSFIIFLAVLAVYLILAGVGKVVGENTIQGRVPTWVLYIGTAASWMGVGFFDGAFRP